MFDITLDEVNSFEGKFYRPTWINGPITLMRFSDSGRGEQGRLGRFWMYGDYVHDLLDSGGHSALRLIGDISKAWAICDDWGDKQLLTLMDVSPTASVPAMWGRAKFQPKVSSRGQRDTNRSYEGGALQLVIPVIDTNRQPNLGVIGMITRRLSTSDLLRPGLRLENPWVTAQRKAGRNI